MKICGLAKVILDVLCKKSATYVPEQLQFHHRTIRCFLPKKYESRKMSATLYSLRGFMYLPFVHYDPRKWHHQTHA